MNINDIIVLLGLTGITALGFFQGTIRLLVSLAAFYLSLVLASLYYRIVGFWLARNLDTNPAIAPAVGFGLVLIVSAIILIIALLYTFRYAAIPRSLLAVDKIIGTVLGLLLAVLVIGMYATVMRFIFVDNNPASTASYPILISFQSSVRTSFLLQYMLRVVLPLVMNTLNPILPDEANFIFNI